MRILRGRRQGRIPVEVSQADGPLVVRQTFVVSPHGGQGARVLQQALVGRAGHFESVHNGPGAPVTRCDGPLADVGPDVDKEVRFETGQDRQDEQLTVAAEIELVVPVPRKIDAAGVGDTPQERAATVASDEACQPRQSASTEG